MIMYYVFAALLYFSLKFDSNCKTAVKYICVCWICGYYDRNWLCLCTRADGKCNKHKLQVYGQVHGLSWKEKLLRTKLVWSWHTYYKSEAFLCTFCKHRLFTFRFYFIIDNNNTRSVILNRYSWNLTIDILHWN